MQNSVFTGTSYMQSHFGSQCYRLIVVKIWQGFQHRVFRKKCIWCRKLSFLRSEIHVYNSGRVFQKCNNGL